MKCFLVLKAIFSLTTRQIQAEDNISNPYRRISQHSHINKLLETLSDNQVLELLKQGSCIQSSCGKTIKIELDGIPIFVKLLPLNAIEGNFMNIGSTNNLFELPLYYQYGVGSAGFNVWRELSVHVMTTKWVLDEESKNFPLMYHSRILENFQEVDPINEKKFKRYIAYWGNSSAIANRYKANLEASSNLIIFLEYIPETLNSWLTKELKKSDTAIDNAIAMVEKNLQEVFLFLNKKETLHFDGHFDNILTDGKHFYLSDFGLSISSEFTLSKEEVEFYKTHANYDRYYTVTNLVQWIIENTFGKEALLDTLKMYADGRIPPFLPKKLTPYLSSIIKRYAPVCLKMTNFFDSLIKKTKDEPYPAAELDQLWSEMLLNSTEND